MYLRVSNLVFKFKNFLWKIKFFVEQKWQKNKNFQKFSKILEICVSPVSNLFEYYVKDLVYSNHNVIAINLNVLCQKHVVILIFFFLNFCLFFL